MNWKMAEMIGYQPLTTFWDDFTIAEKFDTKAIMDTAEKAFNEWKDNYKYLTELIMVINHKSWYWHEKRNEQLTNFYIDMYYKYDARAIRYLEDNKEALTYYFRTLD